MLAFECMTSMFLRFLKNLAQIDLHLDLSLGWTLFKHAIKEESYRMEVLNITRDERD